MPVLARREKRRRLVHNQSEQRRARRINDNISVLRDMVSQHGILSKTDKGSILEATARFLAALQRQISPAGLSAAIESVHDGGDFPDDNSINGESTVSGGLDSRVAPQPRLSAGLTDPDAAEDEGGGGGGGGGTSPLAAIDYHSVFQEGAIAQVVSAPDGRILDCNRAFCKLTGFRRSEMLEKTVLHITQARKSTH